mmetsp:Transcript_29634/g.60839  ORF Transcript_29634/g.60839 Transcript_29634/m.60839 type:complete len:231 (-) Transcript_29634:1104-1796(-)
MSASDISHSIERDITTFGCYTIGQLPREHPAVHDTTNSDRGLEGAFLGWDLLTPTCWIYSFRMQRPVRMKDPTFFNKDFPFLTPEILLNKHDITPEEIALMHETDKVHEGVVDEEECVEDSDANEYCTPHTQPASATPLPAPLLKPAQQQQQQQLPPPPAPSPVPSGVQTRAQARQQSSLGTRSPESPRPLRARQPHLPAKHQEPLLYADPAPERNPATWTSGAKVPLDA